LETEGAIINLLREDRD